MAELEIGWKGNSLDTRLNFLYWFIKFDGKESLMLLFFGSYRLKIQKRIEEKQHHIVHKIKPLS